MAFGQTTLIAALVANGFSLVLFGYLVWEGFQLSKADDAASIEYRKPWVDKLMALTQAVLCLALVGVAVALGYRHFSGF
jgi:hypothetical protein